MTAHGTPADGGPGGTTPDDGAPGLTYAAAGVDTEAGDLAVELMKDAVRATHGPHVVGGVGGFAGLFDASALAGLRKPLLATSTDGVGTKVAIAQAIDKHDTIGFDLVGMVVDDIVAVGARPLFMTDYIACGRVVPERIAAIVRGIAEACQVAGTALVGGETAEHPGLLGPEEYDVAGAVTGVVEADEVLGPEKVRAGDVVVALASSGLHANGFSLVRKVVEVAGWSLERHVAELGRTLGEELLEPTRVYAADVLAMVERAAGGVHAVSHVTGGGLAANLARVLPAGLAASVDRAAWRVPPVFELVRTLGGVPWSDLERTLNLGVGMIVVVDPDAAPGVTAHAAELELGGWVLGEVAAVDEVRAPEGLVAGTKGVHAGAVAMSGRYRT